MSALVPVPVALTALAAIQLGRLRHAIRHRPEPPTLPDLLGDLFP